MSTLFERIWEHKFTFLGTFFLIFTLSYIVLLAVDFLPEPPEESSKSPGEFEVADSVANANVDESLEDSSLEQVSDESVFAESVTELDYQLAIAKVDASAVPVQLSIKKLGREVVVLNPASRTIADLDAALLNGVVRHPDSATLTQEGNVFILGHSSYLPTVFNKSFQAFNGIQNLAWGDIIELSSEDTVYEYRVEKVYRAQAKDVTVPIAGSGHSLTLATCNSFGSTDDRYIVEAKRISARHL